MKGIESGPIQFKSARKVWPCLNCSQKLDDCSLARAREISATARMLGFSLKCAQFLYGKTGLGLMHARAMNFSGNMLSRFVDVLLNLTHVTILRERHQARKNEI